MRFSDKSKEQIRRIIETNGYFAIYRKSYDTEPVLIMENEDDDSRYHYFSSINDLETLSGFFIIPYDYDKGKHIVVINPQYVIKGYEAINSFLSSIEINGNTDAHNTEDVLYGNRDGYNKAFDAFIGELASGSFQKLVLTRNTKKQLPENFDYLDVFENACNKYPDQMVCMWHSPATSSYICATPEIMLRGKGNKYTTVSLAGTMPNNSDVIWSNKNKEEQEIVSDYIRNVLKDCNISFSESGPHTVSAGNIKHLKTIFEFNLNNDNKLKLLSALYPTPAISGFPKEAKNFILKNEGYDRDYYSAIIGPMGIEDETDLYINLRTAKIKDGFYYPYAGGGILKSSNVDEEWMETEVKMKTICDIIHRL